MPEPGDAQEYTARFYRNQQVTGFGLDGVTVHIPCPFCAAPDWQVHLVIESQEAMQQDTLCRECGRSAKALAERDQGSLRFEFVQTDGPEQPAWLLPHMRRVDGGATDDSH